MPTVKFKAPKGVTQISFGGKTYKANNKGTLEAPEEASLHLFQFGFVLDDGEVAEPDKPAVTADTEPESNGEATQ